MEHHILIIEDNPEISGMVTDALTKSGYLCTQAFSGTEGLLQMELHSFHLILLDLMLPGMSGEEVLKKIKPANPVPVIIMSAKDELDSKVNLLESGAEDYITKPFELKELLARIAVQIRRNQVNSVEVSENLTFKELTLDKEQFTIIVDTNVIPLTKQEFKIMELLMTYPSKVFSRQDIYNYAWDDYYIGEDKTIYVHISNIRQKIKKYTDTEYIDTVWGIGFRLAR